MLEDIRQCQEAGIQAQEAATRLIKLGTNLKSLDVGTVITLSAQYQVMNLSSGAILPLKMILAVPDWKPDDLAALGDESVSLLLNLLAQDNSCPIHAQAKRLMDVLNRQTVEILEVKDSLLYLWLGHQLVTKKRGSEALRLCASLARFGIFWHRQITKIHLRALISEGKLKHALVNRPEF